MGIARTETGRTGKLIEARTAITFEMPTRVVERVFIHHSASDTSTLESVRKLHVVTNGWNAIGYNYLIRQDGGLELGRPISAVPAAQGRGNNARTIAICLHGALHTHPPTDAQLATLRELCKQINEAYEGTVTFHGHKEVRSTQCPGFDYINALKLDSVGHLGLDNG